MILYVLLAFGLHADHPSPPAVPARRFGQQLFLALVGARDARANQAHLDGAIDALVLLNRWVQRGEFERGRCHARATFVVEAQARRAIRALGPLNGSAAVRVAEVFRILSERTRAADFAARARGPAQRRRRRRERQLATEACVQAGALSVLVDAVVGGTAFGCGCLGWDLGLALVAGNLITGAVTWLGQEDERDVLKLDEATELVGDPTFSCVADLIE